MPRTISKIRRSMNIEERRARVGELYLAGNTEREIAAIVGVGPSQVHRDLDACRSVWLDRASKAVEQHVAELTAHHWRNYYDLLASYRASKGEQVTIREETVYELRQREDGTESKIPVAINETRIVIQHPGNPALMAQATSCLDKIARLQGLYKSRSCGVMSPHSNAAGPASPTGQDTYIDLTKAADILTDEELELMWKLLNCKNMRYEPNAQPN